QLAELIGEGELRALLEREAIAASDRDLQHLPERFHARSADAVHDLLLRLGDLSPDEIAARAQPGIAASAVPALIAARRVLLVRIAGGPRVVAVEDAARYRDGLGAPLPTGLPAALLEPAGDAIGDLVRRYARTHGPFTAAEAAARFGIGVAVVDLTLRRLADGGRVVEGEFRPGGRGREWCDAEVLRSLRRRSLAALRQDVEPVDVPVLGRFLTAWHGLHAPRAGLDALLDAIEQLQGAPLVASVLEREILPARVAGYLPAQLDTLVSAGEVIWVGVEPLGERDGRVALYLADQRAPLMPPRRGAGGLVELEARIAAWLMRHGAAFFGPLHEAVGGGFPQDTVDALWSLVWKGLLTNDTLQPLRAYTAGPERTRRDARANRFRSRRLVPPTAEGRWSMLDASAPPSPTVWAAALTRQLLARHGLVTRNVIALEPVPGGFSAVYPVLRRLEDTGRVRRGYFVADLGGAQFAEPGAIDRLRAERDAPTEARAVTLAATDPANPYGAVVEWPVWTGATSARASRVAGARVVLVDGYAVAWIARGDRQLLVALSDEEPERGRRGRALAQELVRLAHQSAADRRGWLIAEINGTPAASSAVAAYLVEAGFAVTSGGLQLRVARNAARGSADAAAARRDPVDAATSDDGTDRA
ncbi:MAG: crosslink repair DNA glycosylase YcaQ family protein, partial [Acidobacteriota bacterium]